VRLTDKFAVSRPVSDQSDSRSGQTHAARQESGPENKTNGALGGLRTLANSRRSDHQSVSRDLGAGGNISNAAADHQTFPKWNASQRHVISANTDSVIRSGAKVQGRASNVPQSNRHVLAPKPNAGDAYTPFGEMLGPDSLKHLTLQDRLDLHAHGSLASHEVANMSPSQMADRLASAGLQETGVLKLQACNAGRGQYLEELGDELNKRNVKIGYLSGPEGLLIDTRLNAKLFGKEFTVPKWVTAKVVQQGTGPSITPESFRTHVVKGNVDVRFRGTRYNTPPAASDKRDTNMQVSAQPSAQPRILPTRPGGNAVPGTDAATHALLAEQHRTDHGETWSQWPPVGSTEAASLLLGSASPANGGIAPSLLRTDRVNRD
jgi:hypothetical protein